MIQIDIKMPNSCSECPLYTDTEDDVYNHHCALIEDDHIFMDYEYERHELCPLIEVDDSWESVSK